MLNLRVRFRSSRVIRMVISENAREAPVVATALSTTVWQPSSHRCGLKVLGVTTPDVHTSFFDAGGTSIQAITLGFGLNDAFDLDLPQGIVFRAPTIWELSDFIRSAAARAGPARLCAQRCRGGGQGSRCCSFRAPREIWPECRHSVPASSNATCSASTCEDSNGSGRPLHTVSEITADLADELDASKDSPTNPSDRVLPRRRSCARARQ